MRELELTAVRRLTAAEYADAVPALAELFAETVAAGASMGFLHPFTPADAAVYWRAQQPAVAAGGSVVWTAHGPGGELTGMVTLVLCAKQNGAHRAEVVKLMVARQARGRGTAGRLLAAAEQGARQAGVRLLMLDTETGSPAERLYQRDGWTRYGTVPRYAAGPAGALGECSFFYKEL
ncbi:GNAT family N-acetyltransferase [Kitasatospora sp. NPDC058965]|uniref:GNAT family N-acetyltransferase n=1 Tax=Kitasatospora sp. NPDC058965 TaxID=3346682 RepID=UPI0036CC9611